MQTSRRILSVSFGSGKIVPLRLHTQGALKLFSASEKIFFSWMCDCEDVFRVIRYALS